MSVVPNGRIERDGEGRPTLVITREFTAPIEDVWASVTEPQPDGAVDRHLLR